MDKLKNDEKLKHTNRPDFYSQGCAFTIIGLMFLLLTLVTSYKTLTVLPLPQVYWGGSMIVGATGFPLLIIVWAYWRGSRFLLSFVLLIAVFGSLVALAYRESIYIGVIGSWIFGIPYFFLRFIPPIIFPLLLIGTVVYALISKWKSVILLRSSMVTWTYLLILFTAVYSWGHAFSFEGYRYDEGLKVDGTSYHAIVLYGWLGDPGLVYLYECRFEIIGCELIYKPDTYTGYHADATQLFYDETVNVIRLEYDSQYSDIPPILYEHPLQQE